MKKFFLILCISSSAFAMAQSKKALLNENKHLKLELEKMNNTEIDFNDDYKKFSYSVVQMIIGNLKQQGVDSLDQQAATAALQDFFAGTSQLSDAEIQNAIQSYMQTAMARKAEAAKETENKFLAENAKKEGVVTLPSGLQYQIISSGTGVGSPTATSTVTVHYTGALVDGTVFDSSVKRGQPASFPVNGVIKGWTEALQLMQVGDKWKLFIPSDLGYGAQGAGGSIPPYSLLIFDVELLEIK